MTTTTTKRGARAGVAALAVAFALLLLGITSAPRAHAAESLTVNLASGQGQATQVGEGFLYGVSQDATQPADRYILPLGITAFRGGGHASGGWIADNYQYGSATKADVAEIIAQAKRLTKAPYHAQYQVILSDVYGADGGQPSSTTWPCTNGNCSNLNAFIDNVVGALQASGLSFAYDIWNEPDISAFWPNASVNSTQYFQMWDSAYREIRKDAPGATIVGPSLAFTPLRNAGEWKTWLAHVKSAGTVPDEITNHDEGDVDDPVAVGQAINSDLSAAGISARPLSANEYQPADRQTAGVTAWYLARFAQSGYTNAMRGNWACCQTPNLTGVLTLSGGSWVPNGNWWAMRAYADMTGTKVATSGQVGSTAISATVDSGYKRAVAIIGDSNGYTGSASVTFNGLASQSWLTSSGSVRVIVDRIPDQGPLNAPQAVLSQTMSASSGSITVPLTFQAAHDAFAVYVVPNPSSQQNTQLVSGVATSRCLDAVNQGTGNGTATDIWDCNGQSNQRWNVNSNGTITGVQSGLCLDANNQGTSNGTAVVLWSCNGQANQQWTVNSNGTITGVQSGLCLDANGAGTTNGTSVILWSCSGQSNQQWFRRG